MHTHPLLGNEEGKHSMSQERGEVLNALLREGHLASRASRDEAFWRSQINFELPNPATDEKALWSKGKRVRCHTPCLPKVPRGRGQTQQSDDPRANTCHITCKKLHVATTHHI